VPLINERRIDRAIPVLKETIEVNTAAGSDASLVNEGYVAAAVGFILAFAFTSI
jgi:hypothetical protein